jgi:hypothetical protein
MVEEAGKTSGASSNMHSTFVKESDVKQTFWLGIVLAAASFAQAECPNQPRTTPALLAVEQQWAHALDQHDSSVIACILADEFQDADVDGNLHSRNEALARVPQPRRGANQLSQLDPHTFGDVAYVRGLNTVVDPGGQPLAQVRFTDIFTYRDHRWQAIAGQETLVKALAAKP